jgi:uncharacterized protein (DUF2147 family)
MIPSIRNAIMALCLLPLLALAGEADIEGRWLSGDGEGWIIIRRVGDGVEGTIAGSPTRKQDEPPRYDDLNPNSELRSRPLDGMTILSGFAYDGDDHWTGGTIYDPNSGKTYKSTLTLVDRSTLKVRGYIGVSLFGRSDTWTRDDL